MFKGLNLTSSTAPPTEAALMRDVTYVQKTNKQTKSTKWWDAQKISFECWNLCGIYGGGVHHRTSVSMRNSSSGGGGGGLGERERERGGVGECWGESRCESRGESGGESRISTSIGSPVNVDRTVFGQRNANCSLLLVMNRLTEWTSQRNPQFCYRYTLSWILCFFWDLHLFFISRSSLQWIQYVHKYKSVCIHTYIHTHTHI